MTTGPDQPQPPGGSETYPPPPGYPPPLQTGYDLPPAPPVAPGHLPAEWRPQNLAGPWRRFGAFWLNIVLVIVTLVIGWIVWSLVVWKEGRTPAFQVLHMRSIHSETGQPINWAHSAIRNFLTYGLLFGLFAGIPRLVGSFWVFGEKRQALWDMMNKTYVVHEP
ncbi:MAG TPA: RDD family protein [Mycobacteriales bacterium]|nr:RDD family protein [Mycobacteriales bacterium]